ARLLCRVAANVAARRYAFQRSLKQRHVERKRATVCRTEGEPPLAILLRAEIPIVQPAFLDFIATDDWHRRGRHVLHDEPLRAGFANAPLELRDQVAEVRLMAVRPDEMHKRAERLTWRPANHAVKYAIGRVEPPDVATPQHVRTAHHA